MPVAPLPLSLRESPAQSGTSPLRQNSDANNARFAAALEQAHQTGRVKAPGTAVSVARTRTVLTGEQAASALKAAWKNALGTTPSKGTLSVLTAQWAHETGRGQSMMNFNFGGIKGTGPSGLTATYATTEGWGNSERQIHDGFRAYDSAEQGATDYMSLLVRRYPNAVNAAQQENPVQFVQALKDGGYFTGNPTAYANSVSSLANQAYNQGFDAIGASVNATTSVPRNSPSTRDYFSMSPATRTFTPTNNIAESLQAFLSAEQMNRVTLLISSLPVHRSNDAENTGGSNDENPAPNGVDSSKS